ncbi:hypothetical protein BT93_C1997 [Corymbia citriodora subsp. variegata]|uniref:RING-type E3 ubiquitin transferase n=1 Tax=Corymbia citriodora subsp. variegata TaxID=360336 RepID=A0A8T0CKZ3_CORYI|nr:hypothetical protein BT93_L3693 [Corymbia citriodora subsp. variegata]KAF8036162.1 hypothetical protein BT93_C1997 [Corymbia citriodora subsp. variegata]
MRDVQSPYRPPPSQPPPPPPPPPAKSNLPMLYYGLVVVGTAAIVLALYNLIIIRWCTNRYRSGRRLERLVEVPAASRSFENPHLNLLSSFKYKKDAATAAALGPGSEYECAVCLSAFEEGEEVRQLPRCKHSFHVSCIDMWLYSHSDCPLCRSPAHPTALQPRLQPSPPPPPPGGAPDNSREGLLESGVSV